MSATRDIAWTDYKKSTEISLTTDEACAIVERVGYLSIYETLQRAS